LVATTNALKVKKTDAKSADDSKEKSFLKELLKNVGQSIVLAMQIQWSEEVEKKLEDIEAKAAEGKDNKKKGDTLKHMAQSGYKKKIDQLVNIMKECGSGVGL